VDLGIAGRTALVMGASRGIGRGIAESLAREGVKVAISSRSQDSLDAVAAEIDGEVRGFAADTDDLDRLEKLPAEVEESLGAVDILIANTGGPSAGRSLDNELDEWEAAYRSLVLAPRVLIESVLTGMRQRGFGRIVNVGSVSTVEPIGGLVLSNAHRMAAVGLLKTLAREVAADGVTVNTVATGRIATDRLVELGGSLEAAEEQARREVPAKRLGTTEEYGDLVAFLCSQQAGYLTGAVIPLDGGLLRSV
jgi:3-oxoacyl-[acyl-carrier protein] reductase